MTGTIIVELINRFPGTVFNIWRRDDLVGVSTMRTGTRWEITMAYDQVESDALDIIRHRVIEFFTEKLA